MIDLNGLYVEVIQFFQALRNSVDYSLTRGQNGGEIAPEKGIKISLMVEEARVRFRSKGSFDGPLNNERWKCARIELLQFIDALTNSEETDRFLLIQPFIFGEFRRTSERRELGFSPQYPIFRLEYDRTIGENLKLFERKLQDMKEPESLVSGELEFSKLSEIIPDQQISPVYFDVKKEKIAVIKKDPEWKKSDGPNISAAFEHICKSGNHLIECLQNSNCDRRLLGSVKSLQSSILANANIIGIGLANMACGLMSEQFSRELPDIVTGMFSAYNSSISLYVAQFPEWEKFTKKAAAIEVSEEDLVGLGSTADKILESLAENPEIADIEVPKTIRFFRELIKNPAHTTKRAAFALLRTIENLISSIVNYCVSFVSSTLNKVKDKGSTVEQRLLLAYFRLRY